MMLFMKKQKFTLTNEQLKTLITNFDPTNDPVLKRAIELGRHKHLPLHKAIEIAEKELAEK